MSANDADVQPTPAKGHHTDAYATKLAGKVEKLAEKKDEKTGGNEDKDDKPPAGGFDDTAIPHRSPGYTIKFTFHRATNLPFADIPSFSSDPYLTATLETSLNKRHKQDPDIMWRTTTTRSTTNPEWNETWIVANVPGDGFRLKCRVYDEDPADHDDRLGNIHVDVGSFDENWAGIQEEAYKIRKRSGSKRAYFFRGITALVNRNVQMSGDVIISAELLGRTEDHSGGRMYTIGPCQWSCHFSPMIGRLAKTRLGGDKDNKISNTYNFQANQMQLRGPVPEELYHRYVEFRPFVKGMFTGKSLRGWLLNHALHHEHARIYNYDKSTQYGSFPEPSKDMTRQFLDFVHYDEGGRIFTYVLTLDGQFRFTETGKQFGIDLLSKHTMHSDVSIYIAFSGEFFIRRLDSPKKDPEEQPEHPPKDIDGGPPGKSPPKDPSYYHLIIDNDSGTYRPNKDMLPKLKEFLKSNLPGLKVTTLDCQGDADKMNKMKDEQREARKKEGEEIVFAPMSDSSSISSSDEEDLNERAGDPPKKRKMSKRLKDLGHPHAAGATDGAGPSGATTEDRVAASGSASEPTVQYEPKTIEPRNHIQSHKQDETPTFELQGSEVAPPTLPPVELPAVEIPMTNGVEKPAHTDAHHAQSVAS